MNRAKILMPMVIIPVFVIAMIAAAGTEQVISYQGFLSDTGGQPVTGDKQMVFTIYDAPQGGSMLWSSGQVQIHVENGLFSYGIGQDPPLPPGCFDDTGRWLGIQILPDSEITPRTLLSSVPYSHHALNADTARVGGGWTVAESKQGFILRPSSSESRVAIGPELYSAKMPYSMLSVIPVAEWPDINLLNLGDTTFTVTDDGKVTVVGEGILVLNPMLGNSSGLVSGDDIVVESGTAVMGLYSLSGYDFGSAISFGEVSGGVLADKWAILREDSDGPLGGSGLRFTYGTEQDQTSNSTFMRINRSGNIGIGTNDPFGHRLSIWSEGSGLGYSTVEIKNTDPSNGTALTAENNSLGPTMVLTQTGDGNILEGRSPSTVFAVQKNGRVRCAELELTGGVDLAEPFEISDNESLPAGALVVIDEENPGKLRLSDRPYDTRVAGIISGANGINPGIMLTQQGAFTGGQNVAICGRVYCFVDATYGAVSPGDMLTTSPTPGYAMKATDHTRAYGAVIGKAMDGLQEGRGLLLVLVNLQ